ncbi:predicted protein [Naegleria gruberi]|uniref:Predicted protein n=1 Tax=Naegleria gruberi TaxID=5762 RepID=D2VXU4_NAEGR|nr:uncharacterized protein NAEGRDRAFT_73876 [Naegleria gruberi]EFC38399.1 predicted protein [Naegleria gruberi]|eukprot:XP_002671143.1 predicted protein [Naegleria gruberi strain NEG-M]
MAEHINFYKDEFGRNFVNITSLDHFAPIGVSGISIGIEFGFLASFIACCVALVSLLNHLKKIRLSTNAKKFFILNSVFMSIQMVNIVVRIVSDFVVIELRMKMEEGFHITKALYVVYALLSTASDYVLLLSFVTLFVIISYVQTIFLNSSYRAKALSAKLANNLKKGLYVITGLFSFSMFIIVSVVSLFHFLHLMDILPQTPITISNSVIFAVVSCMLVFKAVFTLWSGIVVIKAIKRNTHRLSIAHIEPLQQKGFVKRQVNPFLITILLISAMVLSVFLHIVAGGVATLVGGSENTVVKIVWQVSTSFSVLVCSSLSMSMFYPMFIHAEEAIKTMTFYNNKTTTLKTAREIANSNTLASSFADTSPHDEPQELMINGPINGQDAIVCVSPTSPSADDLGLSSPSLLSNHNDSINSSI